MSSKELNPKVMIKQNKKELTYCLCEYINIFGATFNSQLFQLVDATMYDISLWCHYTIAIFH